ncbi:MAG: hypothetical protein HKP40_10200 [Litoreibacter sp.]|nr:hypothetical protein [Litoreibacter sp.]
MTALKEFDRLESTGLWKENPQAQRRDVVVSFGQASLIITDKSETALAHWSLAAIERINPGKRPALFRPGPDAIETLEIEDATLIDAIEKIRKTIDRRRPRQGRLRLMVLLSSLAVIVLFGMLWLPGALVRHSVSVVPDSKRLSIGTSLMGHIARLTGETCNAQLGTQALSRLHTRVLSDRLRRSYVVPDGGRTTLLLPGGLLLLNRTLMEDHDTPEVVSGYMLAALETAQRLDPLEDLLRTSGARATLRLLTTGDIDDETLSTYAKTLLTTPDTEPDTQALLAYFDAARISSGPYAYALDITGETSLELIEADPYRGAVTPRLLTDDQWVSLQAICTGN